ncbi:unnamed protein product [Heterobilharzia americana]|nr:unnamed protein product [Heterobilharzia americana]
MLRVYARLTIEGSTYEMVKHHITIGRSSVTCPVDIDIGSSSYVSRQHLELCWKTDRLRLKCKGKNGIFIDRVFQPRGSQLLSIPLRCILRFPSTSICIKIEQCFIPYEKSNVSGDYVSSLELDSCESGNSLSPAPNDEKSSPFVNSIIREFPSEVSDSSYVATSRTRRKQALIPACRATYGNVRDHNITETVHGDLNSCDTKGINNVNKCNENDLNQIQKSLLIHPKEACPPHYPLVSVSPSRTRRSVYQTTYSYAQLIVQAIASQPDRKLTLSGIYDFISRNYSYYQSSDKGWQNSVRHNLSLNRHFIKVPRSQEDHGKGCFWKIDPAYETKLLNIAYRKRRIRACDTSTSFVGQSSSARYPLSSISNGKLYNYYIPTSVMGCLNNGSIMMPAAVSLQKSYKRSNKFPDQIGYPYKIALSSSSTVNTSHISAECKEDRSNMVALQPVHNFISVNQVSSSVLRVVGAKQFITSVVESNDQSTEQCINPSSPAFVIQSTHLLPSHSSSSQARTYLPVKSNIS